MECTKKRSSHSQKLTIFYFLELCYFATDLLTFMLDVASLSLCVGALCAITVTYH